MRRLNLTLILVLLLTSLAACSAAPTVSTPSQPVEQQPAAIATNTSEPVATASPTSIPVEPDTAGKDGVFARYYLDELSAIGARRCGTNGHDEALSYLQKTISEMGYVPELQSFTTQAGLDASNILIMKPGLSPKLLIVGAHYDSVDDGNGYDDNASGVAVLLEVARRVFKIVTPYTIQFILFDAEETDLEGSNYYTSLMTPEQIKNTIAMVNLDSLAAGDLTYVYGTEGDDGQIRDWLLDYAVESDLPLITQTGLNSELPAGTTGDWSDHAPFKDLGIQYVYFEATNWTLGALDGYTQVDVSLGVEGEIWHTSFDTQEYIEEQFPGRIDQHLQLFSNALFHLVSQYQE